eukprot:11221205-Lingulodinium_polyedra.AAC.2
MDADGHRLLGGVGWEDSAGIAALLLEVPDQGPRGEPSQDTHQDSLGPLLLLGAQAGRPAGQQVEGQGGCGCPRGQGEGGEVLSPLAAAEGVRRLGRPHKALQGEGEPGSPCLPRAPLLAQPQGISPGLDLETQQVLTKGEVFKSKAN